MATSFDVPENLFLNKISDRNLLNVSEPELTDFLDQLLISSFTWFRKCQNSLAYNGTSREITADLIDDENEILSMIMVQQWLKPQVNNIDLLKQKMSTREYKYYSQANQLDAIERLNVSTRIEYKQLIHAYVEDNIPLSNLYV